MAEIRFRILELRKKPRFKEKIATVKYSILQISIQMPLRHAENTKVMC